MFRREGRQKVAACIFSSQRLELKIFGRAAVPRVAAGNLRSLEEMMVKPKNTEENKESLFTFCYNEGQFSHFRYS